MSADNKALVRRWFEEVWNKGRAGAINEMIADHSMVYGLGADLRGPEAFKPFHTAFRSAFPDIHVELDEIIAEGDRVAARWTATGTHQGDGLGFPATGRKVRFTGMSFLQTEGDRFVAGWNNFDQLGMLQQLGIVDAPAPR
jgi:steroid delta-isomerase-like uncharacterized protein